MVNNDNNYTKFDEILSDIKKYGNSHNINLNYLTYHEIMYGNWGWCLIPDTMTNISKELHVLYHSISELENLLKNNNKYREMVYNLMGFDDYETNDKNPKRCPVLPTEYFSKYSKTQFDSIIV